MRAANHHGRGTAKHAGRDFDLEKAPHIDPAKTPDNLYWTWDGQDSLEASERAYYQEAFSASLASQNEQHRQRRQYKRVRKIGQVYENRNTQPEGSLLYIGSKKDGPIDPAVLWACAEEYREWEKNALGEAYFPLSMALHVDERGQIHVEERGVYQFRDADGNLRPGQNAALEAAGVPLPDPSKPRSNDNNRKMSWDAARREKWLDIVEAHGFKLEREPEAARPHLGLEAWQAYQDAQAAVDAQAEQQRQTQAALDAQAAQQAAVAQAQANAARKIAADRASTQKWANDLAAWRDTQKAALDAKAVKNASDADVLAELSRLTLKNGRTLREDIEARLKARTAPTAVEQPPQPSAPVAAALQAEKERQERQKARQDWQQKNQGPGYSR